MSTKMILCLSAIALLGLTPTHLWSQESTQTKLSRAEQKSKQKAEGAQNFAAAEQAIARGSWVLETDRIQVTGGRSTYVTPNDNFIAINEGVGTIQLVFNNGSRGLNGAGGITASGRVANLKKSVNKRGNITLQFTIMSGNTASPADVVITLPAGGNYASGRVRSSITFSGKLLPIEQSTVSKGRDLIAIPKGLL